MYFRFVFTGLLVGIALKGASQNGCAELFILPDTSIVRQGDTAVFMALFRHLPSTLEFQWTVSGGRIVGRHGTNTILVLPSGGVGSTVRARVAVKGCSAASPVVPVVERRYDKTYQSFMGAMNICLIRNGEPEQVEVMSHFAPNDLDTLVFRNGRRFWFREAYPLSNEYGMRHGWFRKGDAIEVNGERYQIFGNSTVLEPHIVQKLGAYKGVPVFRPTVEIMYEAPSKHLIVLPKGPGCEYQVYASETFLNSRNR